MQISRGGFEQTLMGSCAVKARSAAKSCQDPPQCAQAVISSLFRRGLFRQKHGVAPVVELQLVSMERSLVFLQCRG